MDTKFSLVLIALVGVGVFALPSTMSLFAGQHSFYNIDATGNQVPCQKCHGDVKAELTANAASIPNTPGPHAAFKCEYCHRIEAGYASGDNAYGVITYRDTSTSPASYRALAITIMDYELKNYPTSLNTTDYMSTNGTLIYNAGGNVITKLVGGPGKLSAQTGTATVVGPYRQRPAATYSTTTGLPLDTNSVTAPGGLNLNNSAITISGTGSVTVNLTNAGSKAVNPGTEYHAASLVSCMECHGGEEPYGHYSRVVDGAGGAATPCKDCHYGGSGGIPSSNRWVELAAGGFGLTSSDDDTGAIEAHNAWVKTPGVSKFGNNPENGLPEANNDACIACHTHVAVDINFQKGYKLTFDAIESSTGVYTVGNAAVEGTVAVAIYGNGSGVTWATGEKTYTWTPTKTLYINGNGAQVNGLNGDNSDDQSALTSP